jgi:hypothetical protein
VKSNREVDAALSKYQWNANLVAFKDTVQRPRSGLALAKGDRIVGTCCDNHPRGAASARRW